MRSVHPEGHLGLIVDSEGPDRSSDCSVDIDDSVRDACVGPQARYALEKRAAIGLILGCEGGHSDRLRIRHLLIDCVEIPVLERPQRDVHLGDPKGVIAGAVPGSMFRDLSPRTEAFDMCDSTTTPCLLFPDLCNRPLTAAFDLPNTSSDGGAV